MAPLLEEGAGFSSTLGTTVVWENSSPKHSTTIRVEEQYIEREMCHKLIYTLPLLSAVRTICIYIRWRARMNSRYRSTCTSLWT